MAEEETIGIPAQTLTRTRTPRKLRTTINLVAAIKLSLQADNGVSRTVALPQTEKQLLPSSYANTGGASHFADLSHTLIKRNTPGLLDEPKSSRRVRRIVFSVCTCTFVVTHAQVSALGGS